MTTETNTSTLLRRYEITPDGQLGERIEKPETANLPIWQCNRCGHRWIGRKPQKPQACAKCRSLYWDKPRKAARR